MIVELNMTSVSTKCCWWRGRLNVFRWTVPELQSSSREWVDADID